MLAEPRETPQTKVDPEAQGARLTEQKANFLVNKGYLITGYVLRNRELVSIIEMSSVRNLTTEAFNEIMHTKPEPLPQ